MGGVIIIWGVVIFISTILLFYFFRNSQHLEKSSVSVKNFFRKYECISSCNLPISWNLLKNSIRKTSFFVLFELLSMYDLLLPHSMNGLIILRVFFVRTLMKTSTKVAVMQLLTNCGENPYKTPVKKHISSKVVAVVV